MRIFKPVISEEVFRKWGLQYVYAILWIPGVLLLLNSFLHSDLLQGLAAWILLGGAFSILPLGFLIGKFVRSETNTTDKRGTRRLIALITTSGKTSAEITEEAVTAYKNSKA